ncbi:glycosyltransferase family 2 protein [Candidatus Laterigemmans baculatus]|uniref:glycosyltransferase family 2 protein n=1 Tax=Candidatus Laterigemmans baculatus TaxID=2770505 RepID=UPI0013D93832|nr:glycosyltransferase family 2 protein [Candidatus Laterigemmans baculatus]
MLLVPAASSPVAIVIPVFNERESLEELRKQIAEVAAAHQLDLEVIFVDDGSTDGSWEIEARLAAEVPRTRAIRFRRNFGKAAALAAGFDAAERPIVMTMDADLQDDPQEIPRFLEMLDSGLDVVSGWKRVRHDPWHKTGPSRVFNWMVGRLTGVRIHDHNCGFKAYRREIFDEVKLYGELHRFVPVLAAARGWRVGEIAIQHHPRRFGHSKYGARRLVKGFLDLLTIYFLTGYAQRPLHLMGSVGLISFLAGGLGLVYLTIRWCLSRIVEGWEVVHLHETAIFYYCILALLFGAQLVVAGLLAEMLAAVVRPRSVPYSVAETVGEACDAVG